MQREKILKTVLQLGKQRNWLNNESFWVKRYFYLLRAMTSSNFCENGYSNVDDLEYFGSSTNDVFAVLKSYQDMPVLLAAKRFGVKKVFSQNVLEKYLPVNEFYLKLECEGRFQESVVDDEKSRFEQSLCNPLSIRYVEEKSMKEQRKSLFVVLAYCKYDAIKR